MLMLCLLHQRVGPLNTMKEHTQTLIKLIQYLSRNNNLMGICQMLLLQLRCGIYSVWNENKLYFYVVNVSTYSK